MSDNLVGLIMFSVCALLTLPGVWFTIRRGPTHGIIASLAVALATNLVFIGIFLALNRLRYGYWTPESPDDPGDSLRSLIMLPALLTVGYWAPLQLIGIVVGWAIRRRTRRSGG